MMMMMMMMMMCLCVTEGQISSVVSVFAGQSAALYCSLNTVKPVKKMFWVTPSGHRVSKSSGKGRSYHIIL